MDRDTHDEMLALAADWDRAMVENDADAIGRYMADDWIIVGSDGSVGDKATFLELVKTGVLTHDVMTSEDMLVRSYGETAITLARGVSGGTFQGRPFRESERASCVFVRQAAGWKCVLTHLSRLPAVQPEHPDCYIGTWVLVPELSLYEWGPVPTSCTYVITGTPTGIQVEMRYAVEGGTSEQLVTYAGPVDGSRQSLSAAPGAPGPDGFALTRVDGRTLDSTAMRGGEVLAYARRVVSLDGQLMSIVQQGQRPEGTRYRNFQVYRRGNAAHAGRGGG